MAMSNINPEKLMMTVRAAYYSFDTYSDVGKCTSESDGLPELPSLEFQTFFKRPDKFRFSWTTDHPHFGKSEAPKEFLLFSNGTDFRQRYFEEIEKSENLAMMVAGATGVSQTSVSRILSLLLPKTLEMRRYWQDATHLKMLEEESVDGIDCYHLQGTSRTVDDIDVWIEQSSLLIRRIKEKMVFTEEDCREIENYLDSEFQSKSTLETLQKTGMTADAIKDRMALLKAKRRPMRPSTSYCTFDYPTIQVNEPIDKNLFEFL